MRPGEDHGATAGATNSVVQPHPITGGATSASINRTLHSALGTTSGATTVKIDGDRVAPGPQTAHALALLGIDEETIDDAWRGYVAESHSYTSRTEGLRQAMVHQEDMGWTLVVQLAHGRVDEVKNLAYINPYDADRTITYRAKHWNPPPAEADPSVGRFEPVQRTETLQPSGAVGAFWSGVDQGEIDSVWQAAGQLHGARRNLEEALKEIQIATRVAERHWDGDRAKATRFHFGVEEEIVTGITAQVHEWERYLHNMVTELRKAKARDKQLVDDIKREVSIDLALAVARFGIGSAVRAGVFTGKLLRAAKDVERFRTALQSRFAFSDATAMRAWKAMVVSGRALADSMTALASSSAVNAVNGKAPLDGWWKSFVFAGLVGQTTSETGKFVKKVASDSRIDMNGLMATATSAGNVGAKGISNAAGATNDALAGPLLGAPIDGVKSVTTEQLKKRLAKELRTEFPDMTAEELEAEAGRRIEPYLGALSGTAKKTAEKGYANSQKPPDLPARAGGLAVLPPERS